MNTTRAIMKGIGIIFLFVYLVIFIDFLKATIRDYEINLWFFIYTGYTFVVYYGWMIPLGYLIFNKSKDKLK